MSIMKKQTSPLAKARRGGTIMACLTLLVTVGCYVGDRPSIHKKPKAELTEDQFEYKSYKNLETELSHRLRLEGRYARDFMVDKKSLPRNGSIELRTRNPVIKYLRVDFDSFSQQCAQRKIEEYVRKEKTKGYSSSDLGTSGGVDYGYRTSSVQIKIDSVFTLTCKPQVKVLKPTRVLVLDSAEVILKEYSIQP